MKRLIVTIGMAVIALGAVARQVSLDLTEKSRGASRFTALAASSAAASTDARVVREHRLEAGSANVTNLAVGDKLIFQLFADKELTVTLTDAMPALKGKSFLGKVEGDEGFDTVVVLETENGLVLDVTDPVDRRVWQVTSNASGVTVRELKPADRSAHACGTAAFMASKVSGVSYAGNGYPLSDPDGTMSYETVGASDADNGQPTVRILVCFDQDALGYVTSKGTTAQDFAQKSVDKMNAALANTQYNNYRLITYFRFVLAGVMEVPNSPKGDLDKVINALDGDTPGVWNDYD